MPKHVFAREWKVRLPVIILPLIARLIKQISWVWRSVLIQHFHFTRSRTFPRSQGNPSGNQNEILIPNEQSNQHFQYELCAVKYELLLLDVRLTICAFRYNVVRHGTLSSWSIHAHLRCYWVYIRIFLYCKQGLSQNQVYCSYKLDNSKLYLRQVCFSYRLVSWKKKHLLGCSPLWNY